MWFETWYLDPLPDFRANLSSKKLKICFTMAQLNFSSQNKLVVELICQSCTLRFWKRGTKEVTMNMKRLSSGYQCKKCSIANFITCGDHWISQFLKIFILFLVGYSTTFQEKVQTLTFSKHVPSDGLQISNILVGIQGCINYWLTICGI